MPTRSINERGRAAASGCSCMASWLLLWMRLLAVTCLSQPPAEFPHVFNNQVGGKIAGSGLFCSRLATEDQDGQRAGLVGHRHIRIKPITDHCELSGCH